VLSVNFMRRCSVVEPDVPPSMVNSVWPGSLRYTLKNVPLEAALNSLAHVSVIGPPGSRVTWKSVGLPGAGTGSGGAGALIWARPYTASGVACASANALMNFTTSATLFRRFFIAPSRTDVAPLLAIRAAEAFVYAVRAAVVTEVSAVNCPAVNPTAVAGAAVHTGKCCSQNSI
jgi:hypothetical protein